MDADCSRDRFEAAMAEQAQVAWLSCDLAFYSGLALTTVGMILVLTSMALLGITGTYLGDYCGILMDSRLTCFPFNVLENPMYTGSTICFLGSSIMCALATGFPVC
jgi:phosphatidylethanolamine/phosphatidyl-N-methylethanolamine N-methyltransferase